MDNSTSITFTVSYTLNIGLHGLPIEQTPRDRYFVHINQNIVAMIAGKKIDGMSVDELLTVDKIAKRLVMGAKRLVARMTDTKPSQWNAAIRDHLGIEVTRKGDRK